MANERKIRLNGVARQLNVGAGTIIEFLEKKGVTVEHGPSTAVDDNVYDMIVKEFGKGKTVERVNIREKIKSASETVSLKDRQETKEEPVEIKPELLIKDNSLVDEVFGSVQLRGPKILGHIDLDRKGSKNDPIKNEMPKVTPATPTVATPVAAQPAEIRPVEVKQPIKEVLATETKAPVIEVKTPTVEAKAPVVEAKAPVAEVKTPAAEVKAPVTEVKTPVAEVVLKPQPVAETAPKTDRSTETQTYDERIAADASNVFRGDGQGIAGPKIVGKIDLNAFEKRKTESLQDKRNKRKRIKKDGKIDVNDPKVAAQGVNKPAQGGAKKPQGAGVNPQAKQNRPNPNGTDKSGAYKGGGQNNRPLSNNKKPRTNPLKPIVKTEVSDEDVQKQIKDTLARLTSKGNKTKSSKYRKDKRDAVSQRHSEDLERQELERSTLKLTEFVTVSDLAKMMDVAVTEVITACMNLGLMVSINQRLDAEALVIVAEEFGFSCEFVSVEIQESIATEEDKEEDLISRPPIVTVMGHVDHGKTSLLDFIRKANVIDGEAGGITQHIGAYSVKVEGGKRITFLDTPGHEAFTAMRARGASVTDVAIIIIAADDAVMPQTIEAINHASAAGVPIVFAINKIDKPGANPDKIREQLGAMNFLVEDWGGKYQCQEIAAKQGLNVDLLLEKVILEAEMLDLKANPNKKATGVVIESSLDKGRGYVSTLLVQGGTLHVGDSMLSGIHSGRVKAMFNERGKRVTEAKPAAPVLVLGLDGAPQAGDAFNVMEDDKSARDLANKREQLQRIQGLKTQKHITLDEIGRRIAIGNFQELNVIVKGDVDGSIEALTDSLIKQSKEEVQVNVIHKAVGQISESDVLLAAASNAVIIGFQVRPSASARKLAEKEEIEIRLYSIIYDAINDIKDAILGMLAPEIKEEIVCSVEIMEVFKISKLGTIAGCLVREGKIRNDTKVRLIRNGIVVFTGKLASLKRFKDDVKEVGNGFECGLNLDGYNDIYAGDIIEGYDEVEVKRKA